MIFQMALYKAIVHWWVHFIFRTCVAFLILKSNHIKLRDENGKKTQLSLNSNGCWSLNDIYFIYLSIYVWMAMRLCCMWWYYLWSVHPFGINTIKPMRFENGACKWLIHLEWMWFRCWMNEWIRISSGFNWLN